MALGSLECSSPSAWPSSCTATRKRSLPGERNAGGAQGAHLVLVCYLAGPILSISPAPALHLDTRDIEKSNTIFACVPLGTEGYMQKLQRLHSISALGCFNNKRV